MCLIWNSDVFMGIGVKSRPQSDCIFNECEHPLHENRIKHPKRYALLNKYLFISWCYFFADCIYATLTPTPFHTNLCMFIFQASFVNQVLSSARMKNSCLVSTRAIPRLVQGNSPNYLYARLLTQWGIFYLGIIFLRKDLFKVFKQRRRSIFQLRYSKYLYKQKCLWKYISPGGCILLRELF